MDIETLLSSYGIQFTDHDRYVKLHCLSPAHNDKHPSMTILKENGYGRCWSCGETFSYNKIFYLITGKSFFSDNNERSDVLFNRSLEDSKELKSKGRQLRMHGTFENPFDSEEVLSFLRSLSITNKMIDVFNIRYIKKAQISFVNTDKPTWIFNRITIPLYENGKAVNLECRDFTGEQSPKVLYPKGGKSNTLFNLDNLDFEKPLYIVEGIKSALRIYSLGYTNVTATLGSALGTKQLELIGRMKKPIIFPDNDDAGEKMLKQVDESDSIYYDYYITFMSKEGQDPADGGKEELQNSLKNYQNSVDFYLNKYYIFNNNKDIDW